MGLGSYGLKLKWTRMHHSILWHYACHTLGACDLFKSVIDCFSLWIDLPLCIILLWQLDTFPYRKGQSVLPGWAGSPSWRGSRTLHNGNSCCSHPSCPCWPVACFYTRRERTAPSLVAVATRSVPPASVCAWCLWEIGVRGVMNQIT